jgi:hypothetical protein
VISSSRSEVDSSFLPAFQVELVEQLRKTPTRHGEYNREFVGYIAHGRYDQFHSPNLQGL